MKYNNRKNHQTTYSTKIYYNKTYYKKKIYRLINIHNLYKYVIN